MNSFELLDSMTQIDNAHILSAQKKLGYDSDAPSAPIPYPKKRRTLRRTLALIAAVIAMTAALFTAALAASPEFRELVFRFLHIEEQQVIPEPPVDSELSAEDMFVEQTITIGDVVQGTYIHTPVGTHARSGVYLVCTDEVEMRQGSHYDAYYEENGEFIKLAEYTFNQDYTLHGCDIHVELEWSEYGGSVHTTWVPPNDEFRTPNVAGGASAVLFHFNIPWQEEDGTYTDRWYPVLLNLHTGELNDVLAGTGAERLPHIDNSAISEDHTKMLLGQDAEDGYYLYYVDLTTKQMYSIDALSGQHADACSLIGDTLACWSLSDGYYTAWKIDLTTLERTELFDSAFNAVATPEADAGIVFMEGFDSINRWGDMYIGSCFALEVDDAQNVSVIDLATGEKIPVEGYTWTPNTQRTPSPDGTKLLLAGGTDGQDFEYVGILDYPNMTFVEFSRDNKADEYLAYWFDENTIIISTEVSYESLCSDYYLYNLIPETE